MQLLNQIVLIKGKNEINNVLKGIKTDEDVSSLISILQHEDIDTAMRASWVLNHLYDSKRFSLRNHFSFIVKELSKKRSTSISRNLLRIFQFEDIPEEIQGELLDLSLELSCDIKQPTAVRAFALQVVYNLYTSYPEIKNELVYACELGVKHGTVGLKSRSNKILTLLNK